MLFRSFKNIQIYDVSISLSLPDCCEHMQEIKPNIRVPAWFMRGDRGVGTSYFEWSISGLL